MHETYRMLGQERELDFERHARNHDLARSLPRKAVRTDTTQVESRRRHWTRLVLRPFVARPTAS